MSDTPTAPSQDHVVADQSAVFAFLSDPATHGSAAPVTRIDTHGAAVFLAGQHAYKVKRAVAFPFMDFSTLEKRRLACEGEIAVNRPNAPDLYLEALPVTRDPGGLALGGPGEAVEWVVHMRRFDEASTLDRIASEGQVTPSIVAQLALAVVAAHARAPRCPPGFDPVAAMTEILADNAAAFAAMPHLFPPAEAQALESASGIALKACAPLLRSRAAAGFVRHCHGDLHLRNIALIDGRPVLFDAIEFNPLLATCDVLYDLAFLLMDLCGRGLRAEANGVLNRYLWAADTDGHYEGLTALPLFLSARAGIRAKVGIASVARLSGAERETAEREAHAYFQAASGFLAPARARLVAVGGLSGSGKSTLAASLAPHVGTMPGAVILRSDVERKTLGGIKETDRLPPSAYNAASTQAVYQRVRHRAGLALVAGWSAIADAVHARTDERMAIEAVAEGAGARFSGLWLSAPPDVLKARVSARRNDASDATPAIVEQQGTYDLGLIDWAQIDVSQGPQPALDAARKVLDAAEPSSPTSPG